MELRRVIVDEALKRRKVHAG
jgi:hypothetical protein